MYKTSEILEFSTLSKTLLIKCKTEIGVYFFKSNLEPDLWIEVFLSTLDKLGYKPEATASVKKVDKNGAILSAGFYRYRTVLHLLEKILVTIKIV